MKKLFLMMAVALLAIGCTNDVSNDDIDVPSKEVNLPATEVKLLTKSNNFTGLLSDGEGLTIEAAKKNTANAYFYIRIDNRIKDCDAYPGDEYFPMTAMYKSLFSDGNKGKVDLDYVYENADGKNGITKYVYSTDGTATLNAIVEQPTLRSILDANRNYSFDVSEINTDTLKVIWYIVKYEDNIWHVDGVLTGKSTKSTEEIPNVVIKEDEFCKDSVAKDPVIKPEPIFYPGEVEVDIHQQTHKDYKSIKTSIHVRDTVDVEVFIPIDSIYFAKADDFNIRTYESYYKDYKEPVKLQITRTEGGLLINVSGVTSEILKDLRKEGDDGLTFEVVSYIKDEENDTIWEQIKRSTVSTLNKTTVKGQITSAFFTDKVAISYTKEDFEK